mmetsp:Transcript_36470/g.104339  ORF Transcript_36470/g.104339 Transcript_36470/m.104339 type:complete len:265 (+) Transcript_36470:1472-2266(+)
MRWIAPLPARNFRMDAHELSVLPISRSTPLSTSWMGSGGIFSARISLRWSGLMLPTAFFAASSTGWISASSRSMPSFSAAVRSWSTWVVCSSLSTSCLRSAASCMAAVMRVSASAARACFCSSTLPCFRDSSSFVRTVALTSSSFCRPFCRWVDCPEAEETLDSYILLAVCTRVVKCRGHAPTATWLECMCRSSGARLPRLLCTISPSICPMMCVWLGWLQSPSQSTVVQENIAGFAAHSGRKCGWSGSMEITIRRWSRTWPTK